MIKYINRRGGKGKPNRFGIETVDEMEINDTKDWEELRRLLTEYRLSDRSGEYFVSEKCYK